MPMLTSTDDDDKDRMKMKIRVVHRKLLGDNPVYIMQSDLAANARFRSRTNAYTRARTAIESVTTVKKEKRLDIDEQVTVLINMAISRSLQSRIWQGWQSWI